MPGLKDPVTCRQRKEPFTIKITINNHYLCAYAASNL
jgi:hypothetical protein